MLTGKGPFYYWLSVLAALGITCVYTGGVVSADTIYVPGDYPVIQEAIDAAISGDEVVVASGTYYENLLIQGKSITLRSEDGAKVTVLDGSYDNAVIRVYESGGEIAGFTLRNGKGPRIGPYGESCGGGVAAQNSIFVMSECVITGNDAEWGVGLYVTRGLVDLRNTRIEFNYAEYWLGVPGTAIMLYDSGSANLTQCIVRNNWGGEDGYYAISVDRLSSLTITNSVIIDNCDPDLPWDALALHCTGTTAMSNTVFWENSWAGNANQVAAYNCIVKWPWEPVWAGSGNTLDDPMFADGANGDFHPLPDSPAIDAGDNSRLPLWLDADYDGLPRQVDDAGMSDLGLGGPPTVDIGVYEFQGTSGGWLDVRKPTPGVANYDNSFAVVNAAPGEKIRFYGAVRTGETPVPGCPGLMAGLAREVSVYIGGTAIADERGIASVNKFISKSFKKRTLYIQALEYGNCRLSDVQEIYFPSAYN